MNSLLTTISAAKAQKPMYSILIYDEIRAMDPPGRFLKQDPITKLWSDIGKKKALDKTRQALREGAPEMLKEMGVGGDDDDKKEEDEEKKQQSSGNAASSRKKREENPLASSIMSNLSIGSFSIDGFNDSLLDLNSSSNQGQGMNISFGSFGLARGNENAQDQGSDNNGKTIMSAQMQLLQQQMNQLQQVMNMQQALQNSGNLDGNMQLQLLQLQMQLQNQMGQQQQQNQQNQMFQQQNQMGQPQNMFSGNDFGSQQQTLPNLISFNSTQGNQNQNSGFNNNSNFSQTPSMPPSQVNDPNIAALLAAIHGNAANQNNALQNQNMAMNQNSVLMQRLQNQVNLQQLNEQINNNVNQVAALSTTNSGQWGVSNSNDISSSSNANNVTNNNINNQTTQFGDFTVPLNDASNGDQIVGMTMPLQGNERKPGGTSLARSQRIGLKNSFTRRPNSHRQLTSNVGNSLMSLESLNLNDLEEMEHDD